MIRIPEFVSKLTPYKAGKPIDELAREKNLTRIVKLASNENPLGPSPKAVEAIEATVGQLNRYTDPLSHELVQALARKYSVQPEHIICGHGTDSLIAYVINAFTEEIDEILTCEGTFIGIYVNTRKFGRKLSLVPLKDYAFDLDAILGAINANTRIIYLANPNNPTGTMFGYREFEAFMERVPDDILVILDEANIAVYFSLFSIEDLLMLIEEKPETVELVFTGRKADPQLVEKAHLVTEMKEIITCFLLSAASNDEIKRSVKKITTVDARSIPV